jgi:formylglycine-generating enzyme required for sulfatase activity
VLGNIDAGRSKSIAVLFDPLLCSKGTDIHCQITYKDAQGRFNSTFMEPIIKSIVCPILKTDSDINIGMLKEFIEKLPSRDRRVYEIQQGFDVSNISTIAREVVEKHDVRHIRTLRTQDGKEWEIWYYGKTKVQKDDIIMKISIDAEKSALELFAATKSVEILTGLLAEIGRDLKHGVEFKASGWGNIINVTIKDSIIQRSNLLDLCSIEGTCPVSVLVEDSVVRHSDLTPERDEAGQEKDKRERDDLEREINEEDKRVLKETEEEEKVGDQGAADKKAQKEQERSRKQREADQRVLIEQEELEKRKVDETEKIEAEKQITESSDQHFSTLLKETIVKFFGSNKHSDKGTFIAGSASENISKIPSTYTNSKGMKFVLISAGEFMMGSNEFSSGQPVHKVTIRKPFYLGKYPVTQRQWKAVMGNNPSKFRGDDLPVEKISWNDVQEFVKRLNQMEDTNKYRLPSEAEWEYSCRAGTTTRYSFGDDDSKLGNYAWFSGFSTYEEWEKNQDKIEAKTHSVGRKKPNSWGLYDMHGNVWEWCQDNYHPNYNVAPSDGSAWEDAKSNIRVSHGSSWVDFIMGCRSAVRRGVDSSSRYDYLGFRVLREL